ncbi:MAG TPA: beta-Ala-His dipeptidase [Candidatus Wirthbacteria bacterium]|nr:beta-Ala-His dipeptidase [Candidatus Wirthbacteria bacterium]
MNSHLKNLEPKIFWKHFSKILEIPHDSGQESKLAAYVLEIAAKQKLKTHHDQTGNLIVFKPAAIGQDNKPTVILQSHLDMVCEKRPSSNHNFTKDAIKTEIKDGWLTAKDTTLGADNGIGLAILLSLMETKTSQLGSLELVFTVKEETTMEGAKHLATNLLRGHYLINFDGPKIDTITIGSCGARDVDIALPITRSKPSHNQIYQLSITGLHGGHSGTDIHRPRINAIKMIFELLQPHQNQIELLDIAGGNARNAIPHFCNCLFGISNTQTHLIDRINEQLIIIKNNWQRFEPDISIDLIKTSSKILPLTPDCLANLFGLIGDIPQGALAYHHDMPEVVLTSNNLGKISMTGDQVSITNFPRSFELYELNKLTEKIEKIAKQHGGQTIIGHTEPAWPINTSSPFAKHAKKAFQELFGYPASLTAMHAGLECGIWGQTIPNINMISIGATGEGFHSPDERLKISTIPMLWDWVLRILKTINEL